MKARMIPKVCCPKCNNIMWIEDDNIVKCLSDYCKLKNKKFKAELEIDLKEVQ